MTQSPIRRAARNQLKRDLGREPTAKEIRAFLDAHEVVTDAQAVPESAPEVPETPSEVPSDAPTVPENAPTPPEESADTIQIVEFPLALDPAAPGAPKNPPKAPKGPPFDLSAPPPEILVFGIASVHDTAADLTGYDGFRLNDKMSQMWTKIAEWAMKNLPMKHWPLIIVAFSLFMAYMAMFAGYAVWRKEHKKAPDLKAPAGGVNP